MPSHSPPPFVGPFDDLPAALEPDAHLIRRIVENYHGPHLHDLRAAIDLSHKVEARHSGHPSAPDGLAGLLTETFDHLAAHQAREEAILFPAMLSGMIDFLPWISDIGGEHDDVRGRLEALKQTAGGYQVPADACSTWLELYGLCGKLDAELREHIRLEEEVLFPRFAQRLRELR